MTIILHNLSWHYVFYYIGAIGVVLGIFWLVKVRDPLIIQKLTNRSSTIFAKAAASRN